LNQSDEDSFDIEKYAQGILKNHYAETTHLNKPH